MKIKITSCCSLPVDENGYLIEIPEEDLQIPARTKNACPVCGHKGKPVEGAIVKSMLAVSLNQVKSSPYYFCPNRNCATVYFSEDGLETFHKDEVRELGNVRGAIKQAEKSAAVIA